MIVVDTNLLIYAYNSGSTHHAKARQWLEDTLSGSESVGLPWQSTAAFVRIMTDVRLPAEHLTALAAVEVVNGWLDQAIVRPLTPGEATGVCFARWCSMGRQQETWSATHRLLR